MQQGDSVLGGAVRPGLPPALRLGIAVGILRSVAMMVVQLTHASGDRLPGISSASQIAANTLCAFGGLELARRHTGMARRGLQVASAGWLGALAVMALWHLVRELRELGIAPHVGLADLHGGWIAVAAAQVVGLAIAAATRGYRGLATAGALVSLATHAVPLAWAWNTIGSTTVVALIAVLAVIRLAILAGLATTLAVSAAGPDPAASARGLRRAGLALRWAGLAMCAKTVLLGAGLYQSGDDSHASFRIVFIVVATILTGSVAWVAIGVLEASRGAPAGRPRSQLVLAAAMMLGGAGALMSAWLDGRGTDYVHVLPLGASVLVTAGLVCVVSEIARAAREQAARKLYNAVLSRTLFVVLLMALGAVTDTWLMWIALVAEIDLVLLLLAGACTAAALMMVARMCRAGADLQACAHADLPVARVVG